MSVNCEVYCRERETSNEDFFFLLIISNRRLQKEKGGHKGEILLWTQP